MRGRWLGGFVVDRVVVYEMWLLGEGMLMADVYYGEIAEEEKGEKALPSSSTNIQVAMKPLTFRGAAGFRFVEGKHGFLSCCTRCHCRTVGSNQHLRSENFSYVG